MNVTTETEVTVDGLRARIAAHEDQITEAEREIGAAELDGASTTAPTKKLQAARDGIARSEQALAELERREAAEQQQAREAEASAWRAERYRWMVEYLGRWEEARCRHDALQAAEAELRASAQRAGRLRDIKVELPQRADEYPLHTRLLYGLPAPPHGGPIDYRGITPERLQEFRELARSLAEDEQAGRGRDLSQPRGTFQREFAAARRATRSRGAFAPKVR